VPIINHQSSIINPRTTPLTTGGIILCGGKSRRMGRPKAMLPFGPETMLQRVVRLLSQAVELTVVVATPGQQLPELPPSIILAHDRQPERGPLEGLAVGLQTLGGLAETAFVTASDVPLLVPALVRRMIDLSAGYQVAVPHLGGLDEPLAAVYRLSVLPQVEALLRAGRLRPAYLFGQVHTRRVTAGELADVDPELQSLINVNTPEDYRALLQRAGFSPQSAAYAGGNSKMSEQD
jgi:molybdopterin-guanine dinucleotide biosynthesis protein A